MMKIYYVKYNNDAYGDDYEQWYSTMGFAYREDVENCLKASGYQTIDPIDNTHWIRKLNEDYHIYEFARIMEMEIQC